MHGTMIPPVAARVDNRWTEAEDDVLREHWPDRVAVRALLPHRSAWAIKARATTIKITNNSCEKPLTAREAKKIRELCDCFSSANVIGEIIGRNPRTVSHFITRRGWKLKTPAPKKTGDTLYDAVRERAVEMNISFRDLDRSLGYRRRFFSMPKDVGDVSIGMIANAVKALGGRLVIEWEPLDDNGEIE